MKFLSVSENWLQCSVTSRLCLCVDCNVFGDKSRETDVESKVDSRVETCLGTDCQRRAIQVTGVGIAATFITSASLVCIECLTHCRTRACVFSGLYRAFPQSGHTSDTTTVALRYNTGLRSTQWCWLQCGSNDQFLRCWLSLIVIC